MRVDVHFWKATIRANECGCGLWCTAAVCLTDVSLPYETLISEDCRRGGEKPRGQAPRLNHAKTWRNCTIAWPSNPTCSCEFMARGKSTYVWSKLDILL